MKFRHLLLISLIFTQFQAYTQVKSVEISYGVELDFKPDKEVQESNKSGTTAIQKMIQIAQNDISGIKTVLQFNANEASYAMQEQLDRKTSRGFGIAKTMLKLKTKYYINLEQQLIYKKKRLLVKPI